MPYNARDESSGQFTPEFDSEDFLAAIRELDGATTTAVAEAVGCKYRTAYGRLQSLEAGGDVESRTIGNSLLWDVVDEPEPDPAASDPRGDQEPAAEEFSDESAPSVDAPMAAVDAADELPTTVGRTEAAAAVRAVRDQLRDEGPASMRDIVTDVMPNCSLGYDVPELESGDRYRGSWWRRVVKPALSELDDIEYRNGHNDYRYVSEGDD